MEQPIPNPDIKESTLNRSQALAAIINANIMYFLGPRASGKTSGGIGPRILHLSEVMPRSQVGLVSDTYERIHKVLLPSLEAYWMQELGLIPDIDYVVHKKPPDSWPRPLFIPKKYDYVTSFSSGFCLPEISLAIPGSGNGFNLQAIIGDEVKYWDERKFKSEVIPAIRGARNLFGHLPEFQSKWFFTDKFPSKGANIDWVLEKKKAANNDVAQQVYDMWMAKYQLEQEMRAFTSNDAIYSYKRKIDLLEEAMQILRMDLMYYCDALPYENEEVLGEKYFRDQRRELPAFEYDVAIENKDPDKVENPYYPDLSDIHFYNDPADRDPNRPLIMAADYQFSIIPICVCQYGRLQSSAYRTLNFLESLYVLSPKGIVSAVELFCNQYRAHACRTIYYAFDKTAIGRSPHGKTFKELVVDTLTANGWDVVEVYMGETPDHAIKWEKIKYWLNVPAEQAVRINEAKNEPLKKSLNKTPAIQVRGVTKKDKRSENERSGVPPQYATHFPDVFDQIVWACLELQLIPLDDFVGMDISMGRWK